MKSIPDPIFTPVAENIKANREDERKTLMNVFSGRLRTISYKALSQKMTPTEIYHLLNDEADRIENEAGELNHV
ncbi:DUF2732 family protein [Morganella morganii]|uniref:DUF2732 family protein n=1 Tax=Morganella morganii TaxID=582 RepID=UPI00091E3A1E|nr:DUF2732 family protein [Morganella morganii]SGD74634.1 Protein of uncharacterised function (DUF2732) [Mycobacterium tuberculosis]EKU4287862.1 DUF2732 family protein [Morganella morganii]EKU4303074.1 DUF2732 family protein [Morganella morganii]EKU5663995.1 DUF2732 family protein [Morganella morganii]EKU5691339.1 DUF2732 family protein [Morganella morganii]